MSRPIAEVIINNGSDGSEVFTTIAALEAFIGAKVRELAGGGSNAINFKVVWFEPKPQGDEA